MSNFPIIFESDRAFEVYFYLASHGLLLLRSMSQESPQRVDVLFQDVRCMDLCVWLKGICVSDCSQDPSDDLKPLHGLLEHGLRVFRVRSTNWCGTVVAGTVFSHQDDGRWMQKSALIPDDTWDRPFGPLV